MAHILLQPDPIDDVEFRAIKIDIHLGVVKIEQEDTFGDHGINSADEIMVGSSREEAIAGCN